MSTIHLPDSETRFSKKLFGSRGAVCDDYKLGEVSGDLQQRLARSRYRAKGAWLFEWRSRPHAGRVLEAL